jgi:hypothetical protein
MSDRITVGLTPRGSHALREAMHLGADSQTDTVNKALALYANHLRNEDKGGWTEMHWDDPKHGHITARWMIL